MKPISIDRVTYLVQPDEFVAYTHPEYNNLHLYHQLTEIDRLVGLLVDMCQTFSCVPRLSTSTQTRFGGYIHDQLCVSTENNESKSELYCSLEQEQHGFENCHYDFIICTESVIRNDAYHCYSWKVSSGTTLYVHVHDRVQSEFQNKYHWYVPASSSELFFDNLIHLVMIVKNAGDGFGEILEKNIPYIDRWTILDTGSTDRTVEIIQSVLAPKVRGELYQEPFIDFGTSRNRALELAGKSCKFTLMLDDTYYIVGDLRGFLGEIRSDQFADSFSLYIASHDVQYTSNRILKTARGLKYWFKIHEVIQEKDNINVIVPINRASIHDHQSDYMQTRTTNRKTLDLKLLFESIAEEPDNPRHYYYVAQTYVCMENWEMAYKYFLQRVYHSNDGFLQEKIDACFEAARTAQFRLNCPWDECKALYEKAFEMDPTRPDAVYFLGVQEYLHGSKHKAYQKFKQAFEIGYPLHAQYSLKPTLSYHFVPKFLTELCYGYDDFRTGEAASRLYLEKNPVDPTIASWHSIYRQLNQLPEIRKKIHRPQRPYLCFVADGNWNAWTGRDIEHKGLGGSETYIVEMARWIQRQGGFDVFVFCKCSVEEIYEGVEYLELRKYYSFIQTNLIHTSIISRFSEYLPVTYKSQVENVFLVVHDLGPSGSVIPLYPKLKGIFTLTEWHKSFFDEQFPMMNALSAPVHYGINPMFVQPDANSYPKRLHKFIYSSFANRGLSVVLELWPKIREITKHQATLDVYCDPKHPWVLQNYPENAKEIQVMLDRYLAQPEQMGIRLHGWISKIGLAKAWLDADVWFYPCTFQETFCMTALEAAASRTLVISNDLAALQNTVGDRGFVIPGDATTESWKTQALELIESLHDSGMETKLARGLIDKNYSWALEHSWKAQSEKLLAHILPHRLEYRNMYGWVSDIPTGSRRIFEIVLQNLPRRFRQPRILEIGVWTGVSIIEFLRILPDSTAVVIDSWEHASELDLYGSFSRNLKTQGVEHRVTVYKSTSVTQLVRLVQERERFHLIYVDGSHRAFDVYADLILSWALLAQDGIMIIDDYYTWSPETDGKTSIDTPFPAVNHFLEQYKNELKVIYKDYRLFLQKLSL